MVYTFWGQRFFNQVYKGECVVNYIGYIGSVLFEGISFSFCTLFPCYLVRINNIMGCSSASCAVIINVVIHHYLSLILLRHLFSIGNSTPAKVVRLHHPNRLFCWPHTKLSFCIVQDLAKKKNRITVFSTSKWKVLHRCPSILRCQIKVKSKTKK